MVARLRISELTASILQYLNRCGAESYCAAFHAGCFALANGQDVLQQIDLAPAI